MTDIYEKTSAIPVVILSHRKREFLETTVAALHKYLPGAHTAVVVDDSGDAEHHRWLDDDGFSFSVVDPDRNAGYLDAMKRVWEVSRTLADEVDAEYVLLWEEDFIPTRTVPLKEMVAVMGANTRVAQMNLQRQPVYKIEKRFGFIASHEVRGYGLRSRKTEGHRWVFRRAPFTTNPGLVRREVLDIDWPTRESCDLIQGGAEPAMSRVLEKAGWAFGWYGAPNTQYVEHVGAEMKTGTGY